MAQFFGVASRPPNSDGLTGLGKGVTLLYDESYRFFFECLGKCTPDHGLAIQTTRYLLFELSNVIGPLQFFLILVLADLRKKNYLEGSQFMSIVKLPYETNLQAWRLDFVIAHMQVVGKTVR
jgi:hypothetical protein